VRVGHRRTRSNVAPRRGPSRIAAGLSAIVALASAIGLPSNFTAAGADPPPPRLLGPVLSVRENPGTTIGRDGGFSVPLPNGYDFWVFADTPRYQFSRGKWKLTGFIAGSTAAMAPFTKGKPLKTPLTEVNPGAPLSTKHPPAQFLSQPNAYVPDGSGVLCRKFQAHRPAFSARWPLGAALMPDKKNILVPYAVMCILSEFEYTAQGWGFALFNYKTQKFSVPPRDVFPASTSGAAIDQRYILGSPIVVGNKVTFYSRLCCSDGSALFSVTVDATLAALRNPANYAPTELAGLPATYDLHVGGKSATHKTFSMYSLTGDEGEYSIYTATAPTGPWSQTATGVLPRCGTSPRPCHSMALHPELSPAGRLVVSYHLAGFGPGIATEHPYPHEPLRHVVSASIPCNC
jgi:hypothetical protein